MVYISRWGGAIDPNDYVFLGYLVLNEPTTGLYIQNVCQLVTALHQLADKGATVIIVEYDQEIIQASAG